MATTLTLSISPNEGYSPDQVQGKMTLHELLEAVECAISDYGSDAQIVLDNGQRYGAQYGRICSSGGYELFEEVEADDDE